MYINKNKTKDMSCSKLDNKQLNRNIKIEPIKYV